MLSLKQINDVCLSNDLTYRKCRYLCQDESDRSKFYCLKLSVKGQKIDREIDIYVDNLKAKGKSIIQDNLPLGDNCSGYPMLRYLQQGYDQKN
jgi:hypothetical protein